uniref:Annexin n=1 Tax=Meloidogyne hapla TaxID=6305 RepID=A0A1I8B6Y2_MELHA
MSLQKPFSRVCGWFGYCWHEIFANRSNAEITQIRTVYANIYRSDLVNDMVGETTGHLNNLIFALCNGGRDEYLKTNEARAQEEALQLFKAFSSEINQNDPTGFFMNIIFTQNYDQLRMLFTEYERIAGRTLEQTIAELYRGALCEGLLSLVKIIKNRSAYFAELLYFYVNQSSTSEHDLIPLLVSRSEIDLFDIIQEYERVYGRSLEEDISNNFFGPLRSGLLAVIKGSQFDD